MTLTEIFSILGGIALFLLGMTLMSSGLRNACGHRLQGILEKATKNKMIAVLVGIGITILIQSSSATDVMVIGFVNAGMMNLSQAIGVIMGANIGTTVTAQITAFNIGAYAPLILFAGMIMYLFIKRSIVKHVGEILVGFGMLFVGISIMKEAIQPLAGTAAFEAFIKTMDSPVPAVLFGTLFTAILQSSSSSTVIFQTFAVQGILSYNTAVYFVIGAAIGSVMPNILASLTTNRNGKSTALLNLIFNLIRAAFLLILINLFPQILEFIKSLSPNDVGRQVANTHTLFAIIAVLVQLPFSNQIIALANKMIPVKEDESILAEERSIKYMINQGKMAPGVALENAHREVCRMADISVANFKDSLDCFFDYSPGKAEAVRLREESVDILNKKIADSMAELGDLDLTPDQLKSIARLNISATDVERFSDHGENIVEYAEALNLNKASMSEEAVKELKDMADKVIRQVELSVDIFRNRDYTRLPELLEMEDQVDNMEQQLIHNHTERIMTADCEPTAGVVFTEIVTDLERCADHGMNIAYTFRDDGDL